MARMSVTSLIAAGLVVSAAGLALLAATDNFALIILANIIMSVGFTPVITMTTGLIVGSAPPEKAGVASAVSETGAELGGALGVALMGSLGTAIFRSFMEGKTAPGLSPEASEAARTTLGGALEAAKTLPGTEGAAMVEAARQTFMTGFHTMALISTLALLAAAWMTMRVLGGEEQGGGFSGSLTLALQLLLDPVFQQPGDPRFEIDRLHPVKIRLRLRVRG